MVNQGYKQTEIGVIPEDWNLTPIGDIADFQGGSQPDIKYFTNRETKDNIRLIQIRDYKSDKYITYIPLCLAKRFCSKDDIMIGRYGPPIFQILRGLEGAYNVALIKTIPKNVCKEFLYYVLKDQKLFEYIELLSRRSSGQTGVDLEGLRNYTIPCPSLPEQSRIAEALSDVDSMISSLKKLIAKKKAVKQGAMQELLTGQKRLPGFSGEWRTINLGEISKIKTGDKNNEQKSEDGKYPFFVRSQQVERINSYSFDGEAILIPGEGNIGQIFHYINGKFDWHQRVYKISDFPNFVCGKYVYYQMKFTFGEHALKNTVKATVDSLRLPTFESFEVLIPPTVEEQVGIATVLSDMGNEIETLEQKLAKTRQIKQGMMQQLLTGKIRFV